MKTRYLYFVFSSQKQKRKNEWRCGRWVRVYTNSHSAIQLYLCLLALLYRNQCRSRKDMYRLGSSKFSNILDFQWRYHWAPRRTIPSTVTLFVQKVIEANNTKTSNGTYYPLCWNPMEPVVSHKGPVRRKIYPFRVLSPMRYFTGWNKCGAHWRNQSN